MKPKRFLLFCMEAYYPHGGWGDFKGSFDTDEEAFTAGNAWKDTHRQRLFDPGSIWFEVIDLETGEEVTP